MHVLSLWCALLSSVLSKKIKKPCVGVAAGQHRLNKTAYQLVIAETGRRTRGISLYLLL